VSEGEVRKVGMYRISRREFLRLGGTGLAEAALLGAAGCGGGGDLAGPVRRNRLDPRPL
jgi:hypothetical protein